MEHITLYSIGCPQCNVLKRKLDSAKIEYTLITNEQDIAKQGFSVLPVLEVNGIAYNFSSAKKWLEEKNLWI